MRAGKISGIHDVRLCCLEDKIMIYIVDVYILQKLLSSSFLSMLKAVYRPVSWPAHRRGPFGPREHHFLTGCEGHCRVSEQHFLAGCGKHCGVSEYHLLLRKEQVTKENLPWVSRSIIKAIRRIDFLFRAAKKHGNHIIYLQYKTQQNIVVSMLHSAKQVFSIVALLILSFLEGHRAH